MLNKKISPTLKALLAYSKTATPLFTIRSLTEVLEPLYYPDLTLVDVVSILVTVYEEALGEPRLEMSPASKAGIQLVLAPLKLLPVQPNSSAEQKAETFYTLEQFYDSLVTQIMNGLRVATVNWIPAETEGVTNSPRIQP